MSPLTATEIDGGGRYLLSVMKNVAAAGEPPVLEPTGKVVNATCLDAKSFEAFSCALVTVNGRDYGAWGRGPGGPLLIE